MESSSDSRPAVSAGVIAVVVNTLSFLIPNHGCGYRQIPVLRDLVWLRSIQCVKRLKHASYIVSGVDCQE